MIEHCIWAYVIKPDGTAEHASNLEPPREGYLWVHLAYENQASEEILRSLRIPENAIEELIVDESRPICRTYGLDTLLMLRGINKTGNTHPEHMISVRTWISEHLVITTRSAAWKLQSLIQLQAAAEAQNAPKDPQDFLLQLLEYLLDKIRDAVDEIEENIAQLESADNQSSSEVRSQLNQRRREAANIRRYLTPQRDALEQLYRNSDRLSHQEKLWHREIIERTLRYQEDLDLAKERAAMIQEEIRNQIAEQQNSRMYLLSIVTAIFLPLSFLTGVFGMNVAGLPGTESPSAFENLVIGMSIVGCGMLVYMKKTRWF